MTATPRKVVIVPCSGIGKTYGSVSREAAYEVVEGLRPRETQLIPLSLLVLGDESCRATVAANPAITIDGCKLACATKMVQESDGQVAQDFAVLEVYRRYKQFKPQGIAELNQGGLLLARALAHEIADEVDKWVGLKVTDPMVDLPKKKVGIVACSGEELPEGTVTRLAALQVLEQLRPAVTVTICLPLFLAGGEGDRAFARFYPTVAVDGCERRCAALATELFSGKPAASVVVSRLAEEAGLSPIEGLRRLNDAGQQAVELTALRVSELVDEFLDKRWNRRTGESIEAVETPHETAATCACGSGIPVQKVIIAGQEVTLVALPLIFEQFHQEGKVPSGSTSVELLKTVRIYNSVPEGAETVYREALGYAYALHCQTLEERR